jgi:Clr5-like protein
MIHSPSPLLYTIIIFLPKMDERPAPSVAFWEIPFQQRWEYLRPIITQLYVDEDKDLEDVVKIMKDEHGFDAV